MFYGRYSRELRRWVKTDIAPASPIDAKKDDAVPAAQQDVLDTPPALSGDREIAIRSGLKSEAFASKPPNARRATPASPKAKIAAR